MDSFYIIHPSQDGWTDYKYYQSHLTSMENISAQTNSRIREKLVCVSKFECLFASNPKIQSLLALENWIHAHL